MMIFSKAFLPRRLRAAQNAHDNDNDNDNANDLYLTKFGFGEQRGTKAWGDIPVTSLDYDRTLSGNQDMDTGVSAPITLAFFDVRSSSKYIVGSGWLLGGLRTNIDRWGMRNDRKKIKLHHDFRCDL